MTLGSADEDQCPVGLEDALALRPRPVTSDIEDDVEMTSYCSPLTVKSSCV